MTETLSSLAGKLTEEQAVFHNPCGRRTLDGMCKCWECLDARSAAPKSGLSLRTYLKEQES